MTAYAIREVQNQAVLLSSSLDRDCWKCAAPSPRTKRGRGKQRKSDYFLPTLLPLLLLPRGLLCLHEDDVALLHILHCQRGGGFNLQPHGRAIMEMSECMSECLDGCQAAHTVSMMTQRSFILASCFPLHQQKLKGSRIDSRIPETENRACSKLNFLLIKVGRVP